MPLVPGQNNAITQLVTSEGGQYVYALTSQQVNCCRYWLFKMKRKIFNNTCFMHLHGPADKVLVGFLYLYNM